MRIRNLTITMVATLLSSAALAVPVQVSSPGALNMGPYTIHDFEAGPSGPGATYSSASGIASATAAGFAGGVTPSGTLGLSTSNFPDPVTITFDNAVTSAGLWFGNDDTCCSGVFTAWLDLYDINGLVTSLSETANMNDFADQFIGFNGTDLITSMTIRYGSGADVGLYTYIDDVYFNVGAQPASEPGVLLLMGLGLVGFATIRRRKR